MSYVVFGEQNFDTPIPLASHTCRTVRWPDADLVPFSPSAQVSRNVHNQVSETVAPEDLVDPHEIRL